MTQPRPAETNSPGRIRAPRDHGEITAIPDLHQVLEATDINRQELATSSVNLAGRTLGEFRHSARELVVRTARDWTASHFGLDSSSTGQGPLFVTGHQPDFVHPGVWMKNVATSRLARPTGGIGLNLVVDNDTTEQCSIRVPEGTIDDPHFALVPYDEVTVTTPWEELRIRNSGLFASFADRVAEIMRPAGINPVLLRVWPNADAQASRSTGLVIPLTAARVTLEKLAGVGNLELPVSRLCQTDPFFLFVYELSRRHEEVHAHYNSAVESYRRLHRIRNQRHPVPNLARIDGQVELPFWYWQPMESSRHRVFAARDQGQVVLSANRREICRFDTPENAIESLSTAQQTGRLRTRALTTTMFARLCFADMFVHGIGGAKYDAVTDELIVRLFGVPAPDYLTLTATWHLPIGRDASIRPDLPAAVRRVREVRFHPEKFVQNEVMLELDRLKTQLIDRREGFRANGATKRARRNQRTTARRLHQEFQSLRQRMQELAAEEARLARLELERQQQLIQSSRVLLSREYPVVLFPESDILEMLDTFDAKFSR